MKNVIGLRWEAWSRLGLIRVACFLIAANVAQMARAQCDLQIVTAGPCLADGTPGTPNVGDDYGLSVTVNVVVRRRRRFASAGPWRTSQTTSTASA